MNHAPTRSLVGFGNHSRGGSAVQSGILYPVTVRFDAVNYAGVTTNNFGLDEVVEA